jgi:hypothetical protein
VAGTELLNITSKSRVVMVLRRFLKRIWSQMAIATAASPRSMIGAGNGILQALPSVNLDRLRQVSPLL